MATAAPARPTTEKVGLESVGRIPLATSAGSRASDATHDERPASEGGCTNDGPFEGCHAYYIKVRSIPTNTTRRSGSRPHTLTRTSPKPPFKHFRGPPVVCLLSCHEAEVRSYYPFVSTHAGNPRNPRPLATKVSLGCVQFERFSYI